MNLSNARLSEIHIQSNKRKLYKYVLYHSYLAGLSLPPLAAGKILKKSLSLINSYVKNIGNELFLLNFLDHQVKLLLTRREINSIIDISNKEKYVILPGSIFLKNRRLKIEIHLCKYNRNAEKEKQKYNRNREKRNFFGEEY